MKRQEVGFIDYIQIAFKWKKTFIIGTFLAFIFSIIISLILPKWYKGTSVIMPTSSDLTSGLSGAMSNIPFGAFRLGPGVDQSQTFIAILKSKTLARRTIIKFDLINRYGAPNLEEAVNTFQDNLIVETSDEGTVIVSVYDRDQDLVATITNAVIEELDRIQKRLSSDKAHNNRIFIGERVQQTEEQLENIEEQIKTFQEKYNLIDIDTQTKAAIQTAADLKAQMIMIEIEIGVLEKTVSSSQPELTRLKFELSEMESKYDLLTSNSEDSKSIYPTISELPKRGLEYLRMLRELEIQKKLLEILVPEYEQAKISEAKDTPTLQILDVSVRPERKSRPRRSLMVIGITMATALLIWIGIIIKEGSDRESD